MTEDLCIPAPVTRINKTKSKLNWTFLYVSTLCFFWVQFSITVLPQRCANALLPFRHNNSLVRIRKTSWVGLKHLFSLPDREKVGCHKDVSF